MPYLGSIQGCEASHLDHDSKSSIIGGVKPLPSTQMILPDVDFFVEIFTRNFHANFFLLFVFLLSWMNPVNCLLKKNTLQLFIDIHTYTYALCNNGIVLLDRTVL